MNYLVLSIARGMINNRRYKENWENSEFSELKKNNFFVNSLSENDFGSINSAFSFDLRFVIFLIFFFLNQ